MTFGWEIDDLHPGCIQIEVGLAEPHRLLVGSALVVFEHGREALLELLGNSLAHHPDAIDGIHQGQRPALEQGEYLGRRGLLEDFE